ncbi:MAG: cyclase family protein [Dissulfuribacterales bacterium]
MRFHYLSYPITQPMPVYGGLAKPELSPVKAIKKRDSCNAWRICFENHWGTHIDGPNHFYTNGRQITAYPADFWMFEHPQVIHVRLEPGELLRWETISIHIHAETDLLLLKSGWSQKRNPDVYWKNNPGIHEDAGIGLRSMNYSVRAVGIDWISVSSIAHREEGRKAHRTFLDPNGKTEPVLLIEDMNMAVDLTKLTKIFVAPLLVEGIDSAPCTIIGCFDD